MSNRDALLKLLATPNLCSKRWVWEQYDHLILGNSVRQPGGDAAVIRVKDGPKGLALTTDVTARYCAADPVEGGKQAVAEAWRNITVRGATPLALTDNLNFGNPERPEYMGQFVGCLSGIGEAAAALDFPIVSGNVSLYNETQGAGILPTPAIGGVGVIADVTKAGRVGFPALPDGVPSVNGATLVLEDDAPLAILLIGKTDGWLGESAYARDLCGRKDCAPPPVDLAAERRNGEFVRALVLNGRARAAHDLSDGGLAVALAEMILAGGGGARIDALPEGPKHAVLFGEDQARYLLAVSAHDLDAILTEAANADVPALRIGAVEEGGSLKLPGEAPILLSELREAHETPLPAFMAGDDSVFPDNS
jgi:phosphoribosylformylglycinamidine synthase subunit PurL